MSLPPLPEILAAFAPSLGRHIELNKIVIDYGELCRRMALEEALTACETRTDRLEAIRELLK